MSDIFPHEQDETVIGIVYRKNTNSKPSFSTQEMPPDPSLQNWVQSIWSFGWDLHEDETVSVSVVPNNCPNALFEAKTARVASGSIIVGPRKSIYRYELRGSGLMTGVRFEPGALVDLTGNASALPVDSVTNLETLFGAPTSDLNNRVLAASSFADRLAILNQALKSLAPPKCGVEYQLVKDIYRFILANETVVKVSDLLAFAETSERTIQRLFKKYIGFSPKHVIRVARFQAALRAMRGGVSISWVEFAASLGYFDQSHFINDFRDVTGTSPSNFANKQNI